MRGGGRWVRAGWNRLRLGSAAGKHQSKPHVISASGNDAAPGFYALATSPEDGSTRDEVPRQILIRLNRPILHSQLSADDVRINGEAVPAVELLEGDVLRATMPSLVPAGTQDVQIASGAFTDLIGRVVEPVSFTFTVNTDPLKVNDITVSQGEQLHALPAHIDLLFSRQIRSGSAIDPTRIRVGGLPVVKAERLAPQSIRIYPDPRADVGSGTYRVELLPGTVGDFAGVGNEAFESSFVIDRSTLDLNRDGVLGLADLEQLCRQERDHGFLYDYNNDQQWDDADFWQLVRDVFNTRPGDVNLDGIFDSSDLVKIFELGVYESDQTDLGWAQGDFNCDGRVDSSDLVHAFRFGGFQDADL